MLEAPVYGLVRRILPGQLPPLRPGTQNPEHPVQHRPRVRWRTTASVGASWKPQQRFQHRPICIRYLSACPHSRFRRIASATFFVPRTTSNIKQKQLQPFIRQVLVWTTRHIVLFRQTQFSQQFWVSRITVQAVERRKYFYQCKDLSFAFFISAVEPVERIILVT